MFAKNREAVEGKEFKSVYHNQNRSPGCSRTPDSTIYFMSLIT